MSTLKKGVLSCRRSANVLNAVQDWVCYYTQAILQKKSKADPTAITRLCHLKLVYGDPRIKLEVSSPVLRERKILCPFHKEKFRIYFSADQHYPVTRGSGRYGAIKQKRL
ncbi:uncharacterized protein LOC111270480 [Varroa jacobsoni]|uniref:uncharacterized protein LOC111270480 n=1 Tax=Varroa jacobsoni TaxID=62625 RepID=UPI000BF7C8F0|nr:uncharacterized protein LOC111270480 [Varroa jacobsoni]